MQHFQSGLVVQLVRIHACHAWGREFESRPDRHNITETLVNQVFMRVFLFGLTVSLTVLKDNAFFVNVNNRRLLSDTEFTKDIPKQIISSNFTSY